MDSKDYFKRERDRNEYLKWRHYQGMQDLNTDLKIVSENYGVPLRQKKRENSLLGEEMEIQQFIINEKEIENAKKSLEREKQLVNEMKLIQESKYCDEKRRMQLRMNSVELREFEDKLKNAYFRKEVDKLLSEKEENNKLQKEARVEEIKREYDQIRQDELELLKLQEDIHEGKVKYRDILLKQQEDALLAKQQDYEEFLRDKLLIDDALRKIEQEDKNRYQEQLEKKERTLNDIIQYQKLRDSHKKRQAEELLMESKRAETFIKAKDKRDEIYNKIESDKRQSFEKLQMNMCEKLWNDKLKKLELDQAREELAMEEYQKFLSDKEKEELIRKRIIRQNLKEMFLDQLAIKADILRRKRIEEKELQYFMIGKCEQEERAEQKHAAERRRKQLEHRAGMDKFLADKQAQYVLQKEQELAQHRELEEMEKEYDRLIKLEKIRLLKEHGQNLLNYLPKEIMQNDFTTDLAPKLKDATNSTRSDDEICTPSI